MLTDSSDTWLCLALLLACVAGGLILRILVKRMLNEFSQPTLNKSITIANQPTKEVIKTNGVVDVRIALALVVACSALVFWVCTWTYNGESFSDSPLLQSVRFFTGGLVALWLQTLTIIMTALGQHRQCARSELTIHMNWIAPSGFWRNMFMIRITESFPWIFACIVAPNIYLFGSLAGSLSTIISASTNLNQAMSSKRDPNCL